LYYFLSLCNPLKERFLVSLTGLNPKADAKVGITSIPTKLFKEKMKKNMKIFGLFDKIVKNLPLYTPFLLHFRDIMAPKTILKLPQAPQKSETRIPMAYYNI